MRREAIAMLVCFRRGLFPLRPPSRSSGWNRPRRDGAAIGLPSGEIGAADKAQPAVVEIVSIKFVDNHSDCAGGDKWIEDLILEDDADTGRRLISVVAADDALAG